MVRNVFYSFHYTPDNWRASQIRNMHVLEGNAPIRDNDWETIKKGGDKAIANWIDSQMSGKSCAIVLIGAGTANRKWINYEIVKAWDNGKGVLGIHVHNLKDSAGNSSVKGGNPFDYINYGNSGKKLSTIVTTYDSPYFTSTDVYAYIKSNLKNWVEAAIETRAAY